MIFMNAKASHSMKIKILTFTLAILSVLPASAQWKYDRIMRRNFWNDGVNISGIRCDTNSISLAGLYASYEAGDYRTISQSGDEWSVNAHAKSVKHFAGYSMKGSFSFKDVEADDMCGSMFLDPDFFPVDVYEFTPGHKTFQTYSMDGGIAVDMGKSWTIGIGLDFSARNAAKRKDLRYSAYRLDMAVNPSIIYSTDRFRFGGTLLFDRNTETISAEQTGTAAVAPFAFFDEGLALGNWQVWTGNGSRLKESGVNGLPVRQNSYGASVQVASVDGSLYSEASFTLRNGSIGERQVVWYRYGGPQAGIQLGYRHGHSAFRANMSWTRLDNRETVQDKVVEGGISIVKEYGSNLIFSTADMDIGLDYDYTSQNFDVLVKAMFCNLQKLSMPIYPYVYIRELKTADLYAQSHYRHRRFEYGLGLGWSKGFATDDSRMVASTGSVTTPYRHDEVWASDCKFQTAGRICSDLTVNWNFTRSLYAVFSGKCSYSQDYGKTRYEMTAGLCYLFK